MLEREAVYQRVWGYAMAHGDRSVDVFIRKLRQKLAKRSPGWTYIHTHFGVGYRFDPESVEADGAQAPGPSETAGRRFTSRSHQLHRRITAAAAQPAMVSAMALEDRPEEHAALVDGRPLSLTMRELQLLTTLASHPQRIMTREELYAEVWGGTPPRRPLRRRLRQPLRSKLGEALPDRADPHPRDRLPLLAGLLSLHILFTSRYRQVTSSRAAASLAHGRPTGPAI